ncbi:hypothetical protein [Paenibacillus sp. FJAT-27812]|uniref:hypothetical protein n=1 Tax=Paenibacillus sp. FJAT-27812 TaxID=1684143 RepID=UPI0006A76933|nr:hypothetical protein [Paenibacillus sp. FJAT-27812]
MNPNYLLLLSLLLLLFMSMNILIRYIARRDQEEIPPLSVRIWLIPTLSIFIVFPIIGFAYLYGLFFKYFAESGGLLEFSKTGGVFTFSLVVMLGFIFFETLVHPIIFAFFRYKLKKEMSIYTKQVVSIVIDSLIIYFFANTVFGVYIKDFYAAISISVFYHIIQWIFIGIYKCYKRFYGSRHL